MFPNIALFIITSDNSLENKNSVLIEAWRLELFPGKSNSK